MRTRLALALLAVFLPIAGLLIYSHLENRQDRRDERVDSFETIGETIAAVVDGFTRDLESFSLATTITLSEIASAPNANPEATFTQDVLGPYFAHLRESYGILRALFVTDTQGRVLASDSGTMNGTDLSSRPYIRDLQAGEKVVWSEPLAGSLSGITTIVHARPIVGADGKPLFYLLVAFYPSQIVTRFPENIPEDANVSLIGPNGTVMYSSLDTDPESPLRDISDTKLFANVQQGGTVTIRDEPTPLVNRHHYGAFVPVERVGWTVGFTRPGDVVDGPLTNRLRRDLIVTLAALAAGFIAMIFIAERLSRPLSALAGAAAAIARGERPLVPAAAADADVRNLETAMASMSRSIADREEALRDHARVLEALSRVGENLATELDLPKLAEAIVRAGRDLTGGETVAFFYRDAGAPNFEMLSANPEGAFPFASDDPLLTATFGGELREYADLTSAPVSPAAAEANGGTRGRSYLGVPVTDRAGGVAGALVFVHSRAGAFGPLQQQLALGLADRVAIGIENARLYREAVSIQAELRRSNQAKDEFLGLISHELRTPITTIYGGARLLNTRRDNLSPEATTEMIGSIEEESERLYRLVEDLLAIARADLRENIDRETIALGPLVERTTKQFAGRRPGRPVHIHIAEGLMPASAETTYLQQVLNNLLSNADKYSESGLPIDVDVTAPSESELQVSVLDRGPGVPEDELSQIFESFYRSNRTSRIASGKGLGLTVCKRLVEAMSGRIWAQARPGGGLVVSFTLPAIEVEELAGADV